MSVIRIGRALLSVSYKTGLAEFAHDLARHGVKIVSTGGTAASSPAGSFPAKSSAGSSTAGA